MTSDDVVQGVRHEDAVCRVHFGIDVHSTNPKNNKGIHVHGLKAQPYDIPLRALIAQDVDNLFMAGRCISGDFMAHSSYRVTGNAVALGQAAGTAAAIADAPRSQGAASAAGRYRQSGRGVSAGVCAD